MALDLKRDIYQKLLKWKEEKSGKVLELRGARQTGKTYILDKFARENYGIYIYINMVQTSGEEFLKCLSVTTEWVPGEPRIEKPLHKALHMFDSCFRDDENTIVVIDEIQESARVFSLIRQFAREFSCHFIVTGSYLGKTLEKGYFMPMGDVDILTLYTLSFEEFLEVFGKRSLAETIDLYGGGSHTEYDELKKLYDLYCEIGGYPAVVKKYMETQDVMTCRSTLKNIIRIFTEESQRYFEGILEINLFEQVLPAIAQSMIRENVGSKDLVAELSNILYREDSSRIPKKSINQSTAWLYRSHIIGFCNRANECNLLDLSFNSRFYFLDVGVCRYFLDMAGADMTTVRGLVNENFVYIELEKRIDDLQLAGTAPTFGTYKGGEIDFLINNRRNYKSYGIEVKAGKTAGKTAKLLIADHKVEAVYFLKGDTYGGVEQNMITVPIYLLGRVNFDWVREKHDVQ